jgi:copper chaperone
MVGMNTNDTSRLNLLGDTSTAASGGGCCGGGGCGCGHGAVEAVPAQSSTTSAPAASDAPATTEYLVTGMTCGHCVASVRDEVSTVAGVDSVEVALVKGGASRVTVQAAGPIDESAIRAAVEEAGYQLA